tara:strand:- start:1048 stop:1665 length:618 start_codon:yes stop_codon:yes gene_type:complete
MKSLESYAAEYAGNWQHFIGFDWSERPEDSFNWGLFYTSHHCSGLTEKSNESQIDKILQPFLEAEKPDIVRNNHDQWVVGLVQGYSIRVYRKKQITETFEKWYEIQEQLRQTPILNEGDYAHRVFCSTIDNIEQIALPFRKDNWPSDWPIKIYEWFAGNMPIAIENDDGDRGGFIRGTGYELIEALIGLGYSRTRSNQPYYHYNH